MNIYMGLNGQGKTLYLQNYASTIPNNKIITNLEPIPGFEARELSDDRVRIISDKYNRYKIFDGNEIVIGDTSIIVTTADKGEYSKAYLDMVHMLIKQGDVLILDEPDMGMTVDETNKLAIILELLYTTYKDIRIAMHSQDLLGMENDVPVKYYWVQDYKPYEVKEEMIYEAIGEI